LKISDMANAPCAFVKFEFQEPTMCRPVVTTPSPPQSHRLPSSGCVAPGWFANVKARASERTARIFISSRYHWGALRSRGCHHAYQVPFSLSRSTAEGGDCGTESPTGEFCSSPARLPGGWLAMASRMATATGPSAASVLPSDLSAYVATVTPARSDGNS